MNELKEPSVYSKVCKTCDGWITFRSDDWHFSNDVAINEMDGTDDYWCWTCVQRSSRRLPEPSPLLLQDMKVLALALWWRAVGGKELAYCQDEEGHYEV
mgnify:CR=1 FL=1